MSRPRLRVIAPLFVVSDLTRSLDFYVKTMGFTSHGTWGEPPCFGILVRDGNELMLSLAEPGCATPTPNGPFGQWDLYLRVDDVGAEADALRAAGAVLDKGPTDTVYEMREIELLDPDGYRLCLAQDTSGDGASEEWEGVLDVGAAKLRLVLRIATSKNVSVATLDSPDQGASHMAVEIAHRDDASLRFTMDGIGASYEGSFGEGGSTLSGTWTQRGKSWPLDLRRA